MTKYLTALLVLAMCLAVPPAVSAHGYALGALKIGHPWARPTAAGAPTAAGYLTITNTGQAPDRLVAATTTAASKVEIHEMSTSGGVMRMREVVGGLLIAPGATVALTPGGYHLMFIKPTHAWRVGEHVPATLRFQHAGSIDVEFYVQADQPPPAGMSGMNMR